jgi:hypothetical protein
MFSFTEFQFQSSLDKHGSIETNTEYVTRKKPVWWVLLKLAGVAAMVAVGYGLALPTLGQVLPLWQGAVVIAGIMLIYIGLAFFIQPEPNTDNMGWFGGMANDPTQYSDDINRSLWNLHCLLGPGRFIAESLLDTCVLVGLARGEEVLEEHAECKVGNAESTAVTSVCPEVEPALLRADRFERPASGGPDADEVELAGWRYLQSH